MKDRVFLDSNILIYSIDKFKSESVESIFKSENNIYISTQVINEFINVCIKKQLLEINNISQSVKKFIETFNLVIITETTIYSASELKEKYRYSFYDSLIISSAIENECSVLYTEDLKNSQLIEGKIKILNPYVLN